MKKFLIKFKNSEPGTFICDLKFTLPLIVTLFLGYIVPITTFTIGQDDLARSRYSAGQLFSQGRFSGFFISKLFGFDKVEPFREPFTAVVFLFFAAIAFSMALKRACGEKLNKCWYSVFACLFVSYPLINEVFIFKGTNRNIAIGYFIVGIAVLLCQNALKKRRILYISAATFCIIFIASLYESLVLAFIVFVCLLLFAEAVLNDDKIKYPVNRICVFALPAVIGVALEFLIGKLVIKIFGFNQASAAGNEFSFSGKFSLTNVIYELVRRYIFAGFWYLPIGIFVICCIIFAAFLLYFAIKKKSFYIAICGIGVYFGLFILGLLTEGAMKYRMCQAFALFTAFTIVMISILIAKLLQSKAIVVALCGIIILSQALSLTDYFMNDYERWQEEKQVLTNVIDELKNYDTSAKPTVFVGEYELSDDIMQNRYVKSDDKGYILFKKLTQLTLSTTDYDETYVLATCQATFQSVITWGIDAFSECNTELFNVIRYLGEDGLIQGTNELYDKYKNSENDSDQAFLITEYPDAIVVCF